ncbi:MAG: ABC-F family ATP-binding cassette domain-containing protein [Filifactoraceae bacterium]
MNLITIDKLKKTYGEKTLFHDIFLSIEEGNKIGLIGINGTGKTSLLKILANLDSPDSMAITTKNGIKIEYLSQTFETNNDDTIIDYIFSGNSPVLKLIGKYEGTLKMIEKQPDNLELVDILHQLNTEMDAMNAWQIESEAKAILTRFGIKDFSQKINSLSGGQRKRVALAAVLIRPCDLLILDEPTNHIDNDTIEYLEQYLQSSKCAILMVTHDRYFLEKVANTIMELEKGKLYRYDGSYSKYLELKSQKLYDEKRIEEKKQSLYKQELAWMQKGVEARRTKAKYRKDAFYQLEDSLNKDRQEQFTIDIAGSRLGNKILEFNDLAKKYNEKSLFKSSEYTVLKTDRIGIIGENGSGKTTFLNLLSGQIVPDEGLIEWGSTVKIGYFTQEQDLSADSDVKLDPNQKVIEYIKDSAHFIEKSDGTKITAEKMLELFLFSSQSQHNLIGKLSGGEKRRLYLLKILMSSPNLLFLDEPTNDLDIETLSILEDYISDFNGPVITVSHDRYFLDKICNKIFSFEPDPTNTFKSKIKYIVGNYTDYKEKSAPEETVLKEIKKQTTKNKTSKPTLENRKLTYKEQKQWETIEEEILKIEEEISTINTKMLKANTDFVLLNKLTQEKDILELELLEKMELWEKLTELVESLENK